MYLLLIILACVGPARGLGLRPGPTPRGPGDGPLVAFVHGFMASGPVFDPLRARAAAAGFATTDFSYGPLARFETIAGRLAEHLHSAAEGRPLALVGHSLGGGVSGQIGPCLCVSACAPTCCELRLEAKNSDNLDCG